MTDLQRLRAALSDRYVVSDELGQGGMASVYLAEDIRHSRPVALKVVRPELVETVGAARFLREIRITARLTHPHIRPLLDSGEADGMLFYVMPLVEGATLADRLKQEGTLPVAEAVGLASEVADALSYAHDHGVIHRDVKPSNILLESGHAVLTDFGIALASHDQPRITTSAVTLGTAEYMSPEQCSGEITDARSDIYSLGCVLHQMISGEPPFTGRTPAAVVAKQLRDAPVSLRSIRPAVPPAVEDLVRRALKKDPEQRFQTAREMAAALKVSIAPAVRRDPKGWGMRLAGGVLGLAVAAAAVTAWWTGRTPVSALDDGRFAVMSFVHEGSSALRFVDGSRCQTRLREALQRWDGVELVDPMVLRDRELRRRGRTATLDDVMTDARLVGAGRLVWGRVWTEGDTTRVEGLLYDVLSREPIRRQLVALAPGADVASVFDELADSLVVGQVATTPARASVGGTHSLDALRLYDDGHRFLSTWDLNGAARAFSAAADRDPTYAHASLWRSLVGMFRGESYEEWRAYAASAARSAERLTARDRLMARGLKELTDARWQEACAAFTQAVERDSLAFDGWLGLGECLGRDDRVEPDRASPSGWRFRSSMEAAGQAFQRALAVAPSYGFVLQDTTEHQLQRALPTRVGNIRRGRGPDPDGPLYGAHPVLEADTLAYVPYPLQELLATKIGAGTVDAVRRNQLVMSNITRRWVEAMPTEAAALRAHASSLESRGLIEDTGDSLSSALAAIQAARRRTHADSAIAQARAATTHVRILVKSGRFQAAAALADSVLGAGYPVGPLTAEDLAGLALLRGRPALAADLLASQAPGHVFLLLDNQSTVPVPLRETILRFGAFAAAGGPLDSLEALRGRALSEAGRQLSDETRSRVLAMTLADPLVIAHLVLSRRPADPEPLPGTNPFAAIMRLLATGDIAAVRRAMAAADDLGEGLDRGATPFSLAILDAHVTLAVGDTAGAIALLDRVLESLRLHDALLLTPREAGPLVRSMALRAELADQAGGTLTARRWAAAVVTLWGNGEDVAQALVPRMQVILDDDP